MADSILTIKQVATLFGVHRDTVVDWSNKGRLKHFKTPGGHRRFYEADVLAVRDSATVAPTGAEAGAA